MLTLNPSDDNKTSCFKLMGAEQSPTVTHLISESTSLLETVSSNGNMDTCSFYSEPSDSTIIAFCESAGSIAFEGGSDSSSSSFTLAYSGAGESCGSIASSSISSGSSFSGGGCSFTC